MAVRNAIKVANQGGYAYFPGSGPPGKACKDCVFAVRDKRSFCLKARSLRTQPGGREEKVYAPPIDLEAQACKYFSPALKRNPYAA